MALLGALILICGWGASATARAQCMENPATPYVNCNPGDATIVSNSATEAVSFGAPTQITNPVDTYVTDIIGRANGALVYDMSLDAAYGTPTVMSAITAADGAITGAAGPSVVITGPTLASSQVRSGSSSSTTYSLDSSVPTAMVTVISVFGPATVQATIPDGEGGRGNPANPNAGVYAVCGLASLPSAKAPGCMAVDGGSLNVLDGQFDINVNTALTYLVDTTTTTTNTTTTTAVYDIVGRTPGLVPEPGAWALMLTGLTGVGGAVRRRRTGGRAQATSAPPGRERAVFGRLGRAASDHFDQ